MLINRRKLDQEKGPKEEEELLDKNDELISQNKITTKEKENKRNTSKFHTKLNPFQSTLRLEILKPKRTLIECSRLRTLD